MALRAHAMAQRRVSRLIPLLLSTSAVCLADLCADGEVMRICVPDDYMKYELPQEGEATHVSIGVDIKDIPKVNDKDFSITLNAYFIVKWRDKRLIVSKRNRTRASRSAPG